ncbi:MAG: phospholipid carrier-dependent glycosyltransferase [Pleurocapsa minor GSE-CHR-MK-17-07R]|nr:phospholipid carrier-dependent glycosyltransferase [Pleurocapsa minor GSE-CHR-MK 17-07R]
MRQPAGGRRALWMLVLGIAAIAVIARLLPGARTIDDAFITFRYSRNLIEGAGFVYNTGVATLGTTTPLWALLMAATSFVLNGQDFQSYALVWSALADGISCALLFMLALRVTGSRFVAAMPALLYAIAPQSVTFAVGGMETSLVVLWMFAATTSYVYSPDDTRHARLWRIALGVFVGLGLLTRVDSVLWSGPLLAWQAIEALRKRARLPWETWLAAALVVAPFALYSTLTFGSPLPNSVTAKRYAYRVPELGALTGFIQTYSNLFFTFDAFGSTGTMLSALVVLTGWLFALIRIPRLALRLLPLAAYPALYAGAFIVLNPLMFRWYYAPPLGPLMLMVFIGLWALLKPLTARPSGKRIAWGAIGLVAGLCVVSSLSAWTLHPDHGNDRPAPRMAWHQIELHYQTVGEYLRNELGITPETRVASADIGAVGYFSRATIVDTVGLVTPELTAYYPVDDALFASDQNYAVPPVLIYDTQPEYFVTMEGFIREGLAQQEAFLESYTLMREIPTDFYGTGMQVWARN